MSDRFVSRPPANDEMPATNLTAAQIYSQPARESYSQPAREVTRVSEVYYQPPREVFQG